MNFTLRHCFALAAVACAGFAMASTADAKTFKWANSGDVSSMDPYARQETFLLTFTANIYEGLVRRDKDLKLEPALAVTSGQKHNSTCSFHPRPNVKSRHSTQSTTANVGS